MRGHDHIISLRKSGKTPSIVFINDYPCKTDWMTHGEHATVSVHGDTISSLDLRFLVGLRVSISAESEGRAKALFGKAKWFGAKTVASCHIKTNQQPHKQDGWSEIYHAEAVNA